MHHTETQIASMKFYSSDAPQTNEHPTLEITYGPLGNKEIDFKEAIIQPNPFTDAFNIRGLQGNYAISISDMNGRIAREMNIESTGHDIEIDQLNQIPAGIYLLKAIGQKGNYFGKIVKVE
jgi:hypothetical protein